MFTVHIIPSKIVRAMSTKNEYANQITIPKTVSIMNICRNVHMLAFLLVSLLSFGEDIGYVLDGDAVFVFFKY